jgi:hypothetical protein
MLANQHSMATAVSAILCDVLPAVLLAPAAGAPCASWQAPAEPGVPHAPRQEGLQGGAAAAAGVTAAVGLQQLAVGRHLQQQAQLWQQQHQHQHQQRTALWCLRLRAATIVCSYGEVSRFLL